MFTGLISHIFPISVDGTNVYLYGNSEFSSLVSLGDSISINGICLTVVEICVGYLRFEITEETKSRTSITQSNNQLANVELALKYGDRIGGHIVNGHISQTAEIIDFLDNGEILIDLKKVSSRVHKKGSITVNGVSLTIAKIRGSAIKISLIPETIKRTTFSHCKVGDSVNIEFEDIERNEIKTDDEWMKLALYESEKGKKTVFPNPWVGCIIVKNGKIIGQAHHEKSGKDHAEVLAFKSCSSSENYENSTLYCTLEPCCHAGVRGISCTDAIISKGVKKVMVGIVDPDIRVSGKGIQKLRQAGIMVDMSSEKMQKEISFSLRYYIHQRITGLPYITIKIALTLDGCYFSHNNKWITHAGSREKLYDLWDESQAVIIGANTVQKDNPELNCEDFGVTEKKREFNFKRIVFDGNSLINNDSNIFKNERTLVVTTRPEKFSCNKIVVKDMNNIEDILRKIDAYHVIVEGGRKLHESFIRSGFVNELIVFRGSKIFGEEGYFWHVPKMNIRLHDIEKISCLGENNIMERYMVKLPEHKEENFVFDDVDKAVQVFARGGFVLVVDDENRENEGDLIVAANKMTLAQMTEMINSTTGIICVPMEKSRAKKLNLCAMIENNTDPNKTAFTVSVDYKNTGTGVSSQDRLQTIHALADENSVPNDFRKPGHIFPLVANPNGLNARRGHTEAALTLCKLGDIYPRVAVIGELKNSNGTMKNRDDCFRYARNNNIPVITVEALFQACKNKISLLSECDLKTKFGEWRFLCFDSGKRDYPHKVLLYGVSKDEENLDDKEVITLRIHSECFTGDVLRSCHCDCGEQLQYSIEYIRNKNKGILIFPSGHEGRGIGIVDKVKCYQLQKNGLNTFDSNKALGHDIDARTYDDIVNILEYLKIYKIELLTENPSKIEALEKFIVSTRPVISEENETNASYLKDKRTHFQQIKEVEVEEIKVKEKFPDIKLIEIKNKKVGIIYSAWHEKYVSLMRDQVKKYLKKYGVETVEEYQAPGCNEIPFVASKIARNVDGIICIGILIKGDTLHFENISTAVSNGIMQAQISSGVPIMNCILSCFNFDQVKERIFGPKTTLEYIAKAIISLL